MITIYPSKFSFQMLFKLGFSGSMKLMTSWICLRHWPAHRSSFLPPSGPFNHSSNFTNNCGRSLSEWSAPSISGWSFSIKSPSISSWSLLSSMELRSRFCYIYIYIISITIINSAAIHRLVHCQDASHAFPFWSFLVAFWMILMMKWCHRYLQRIELMIKLEPHVEPHCVNISGKCCFLF